MSLTKEAKQELIDKHGRSSTDTGSTGGAGRDADASASTTSPSTCAPIRRITTRGAAC